MFGGLSPLLLGLLGLAALALVIWVLSSLFGEEARRRRRNYGHTVSKTKGPTIKLAVDVEDPKK